MTFNDIVIKNIKKGFRKYLAYYLSGSFCISLFFIFCSLFFNNSIVESSKGSSMPITALFVFSIIAIALFSIIFVLYAHFSFIKNRHKELGVYMTSGMSNKDINKMLFLELSTVFILCLITGLLVGSVFSRLLQLTVCRLLEIDSTVSNISPSTYLITTLAFIVIYGFVFLVSYVKINKMSIYELLHEAKKKEMKKVNIKDYILAFIGIASTVFSIVFMMSFVKDTSINTALNYLIPYIVTTIIGLLFMCNYTVKVLISLFRKTPLYRKNILAINKIEKKFKQNNRIILILSIMATGIILMVGASFSLTTLTNDFVVDGSSDVEYAIYNNKEYDEKALNEALSQYVVIEKEEYNFMYLNDVLGQEIVIVSLDDYNAWNQNSFILSNDECFNIITTWEPGNHGISINSVINLFDSEKKYDFKVLKSEKGFVFSKNLSGTKSAIVVSNEVYDEIYSSTKNKGIMYKLNYEMNYKNSKNLVNNLTVALKENIIYSRYQNYKDLKSGYATFFFVSLTQSIMFFISTGCVLFFKNSNEIEENKEEYNKLFKIGISDKEVKKVLSMEIAIVYYIPLIIGFIFGFSIIFYMLNLFSFGQQAGMIEKEFLSKSLIAWCGYFVFQTVFYLFTRRKSINAVIFSK